MRKNEFEKMLIVGIASRRLALLSELSNRNLFYSREMHDPGDANKIYLLELCEDHFILRSDLIFDDLVERFFYVSRDFFEYNEDNLRKALFELHKTENKAYEILSKLRLRGFYSRNDFIQRLIQLLPNLDLIGDTVKDRKSGKVFITIKEDVLCFTYKDGEMGSYMNIAKKDLNEKVLQQCVELITSVLEYKGA